MKKFLIIQTSFIGDVILATPVIESLHAEFSNSQIDFVLRKGNENLLNNHPYLKTIHIWDKKQKKTKNLFSLKKAIKKEKYDYIINLQRFASTGFLTAFSKAKNKIGFDKNPFSFLFSHTIKHEIENGKHETERNIELIEHLISNKITKPKLYPTEADFEKVKEYKAEKYICIAPTSVWFTKQLPQVKWIELIDNYNSEFKIYLIGATSDFDFCKNIISDSKNTNIENLSGKFSLLQTSALMKDAVMNYVNDSAPMHLASAMNANTSAFFCSTIPKFGFGPLADNSKIIEIDFELDCRPCGLHGKKECPKGHFKCGNEINVINI